MNARSYKTVFSKRLGALVAVGEHATSQGKANGASGPGASGAGEGAVSALAGIGYVAALSASFAFVSLAWAAPATNALPTGGTVVQGAASMSQTANQLNIQQATQRAAINWQSFNIGAAATVNVAQPNAQAVLLNRVVGQSPSQIFGKLQANGHVILVNPNGVLFGKDGSVNAGGFTASTLNISDANFMAGNMVYERNGSTAGIVNKGKITAEQPGGYVALLGATVSNEGSISTKGGSVVMGAGETIKVPVSGTGRIKLELTPAAINASVSNSGSIVTEGGQVYMQALALNRAAAQILQSGSIDTSGEKGGDVHVLADGGHIRVSGSITANSRNATAGGDIYIGRDKDTNVLAAVGDVSSATLESQGGFVETSGEYLETEAITVKAKDWLLDPSNIEIVPDNGTPIDTNYPSGNNPIDYTPNATSKIKASTIAGNLNNGTNVTLSTGVDANSTTGDEGNIVVNAAIEKTGDKSAKLTLIANNRIIVNQRIGKKASPDTGNLDVDIVAHGNRKTAAQGSVVMNNVIDAGNGKVNITATSQTGWEGLIFQGTSGITAGTYTVKGSSLSTAVRFNGGTATFISSSGDSLIEGNGAGFGGVFASSGNTINLNTTGTATTTLASGASSAGGMRFGFGGGVTVNTNGNVTIGSHNNNSGLFVQANVNVNSGHLTLKGKSVGNGIGLQDGSGTPTQINVNNGSSLTMNGIATGSGNGIDLRPQGAANSITMSGTNAGQRGTLNLIGDSNTGAGIYTNFATITSDGGNINLTGTSQGNGLVHDGLIRSGDASSGGVVTLIGNSTGTASSRLGVNLSTGTVQGGAVIVEGTSRSSAQGVYTSANATIKSVTTDVSIKGQSNTGTATHLQGVVTGQSGVTITGETNGSSTNARSVLIENTITAVTGDMTVTGKINNNTDTSQRAITLAGAASKLDAKNGNIDLKTDSLFVNSALGNNTAAMISAAGNGKGIVSINTTTDDKAVVLGGTDSNTQLGIDSGEIAKIAANKLVIGNATRTGNITVTGAITTNSDFELQTQGSIAINQALTVGTSGSQNLTLNAGGSIKQASTGIIKANKVDISGTQAAVTLDTAVNQINQLTASVKSLRFQNGRALSVGDIAGTASNVVIKTTEGARITTTNDNLMINQAIENTTSGDIILGAGVSHIVNQGADSNVQTRENATAKNLNANGKTLIYTGNTNGAGKLSHLDSTLTNLDFSVINTAIGKNADSKVVFNDGAGISGSTAKTQVMFRSQVAFNAPQGATLEKTYGEGTENTPAARAALLNEAKAALKTANSGNSERTTDAGTIRISNAALIDSLGDATLNGTAHSRSGHLKASETTYKYGALTSDKYTTTLAADKLEVKVNKLALTGSIAQRTTTYGDALAAGAVTLTNKVGNDVVDANGVIFTTTGLTSNSGNLKAGTHANVQTINELSGEDKDNYTFADIKGSYTVKQKALAIGGITANDKVYNGDAVAAVNTTGLTKAGLVGADVVTLTNVSGTFRNDANTADDKNVKLVAGVAAAKTVALKSTYGGADRDNYLITDQGTTSAVIAQRALTIDVGTVATKTADGTTAATVTPGALRNLVGSETLGVAATGSFTDANAGNNKAVNAFYTLQNGANGGLASNYILALGKPGNPDTRMTGTILAAVNPVTPIAPVNNNTGSVSRVRTVSGFGGAGAATGVLDDKAVTESREVCSDVSPENCECQPSVIPSIEICFAPKSVAATKEEK